MGKYQLPPLKDESKFEELICDLFNVIDKTDSYTKDFQTFGVKGQSQKGIDVFSQKGKTVIQCKLKDVRKKDDTIRKNLIADLDKDLPSALTLDFTFERFILASTFRDDAQIQEHITKMQQANSYPFHIY